MGSRSSGGRAGEDSGQSGRDASLLRAVKATERVPASDAPVVSRNGGQRGSQLAWVGEWGEVGKAGQELAGSVPALVPGFCGWPWAERDPQGDLIGWAGAGLSGTATSEGSSVCYPGVLSGLWHCQWGCDPYKCLFLVGVLVAGQGCARLPLLPRWGAGQAEERSAPCHRLAAFTAIY